MIDLRFDRVSKRYRIRQEDATHHAGWINKLRSRLGPGKDFWALRDVSFEVTRGETLGIIGHNGSGKSTALKLLASITTPTRGEITIHGRIAALLEVASGFHPELTGRENIFLQGSIIGMRRREIHAKLNRIIDFAEIRPFIDLPVKRYSSGMFVRLGFSIAAHLEPEILLLDEVLAVGDMTFQKKCVERILELSRSGMTIVFISHDLAAVERLCERAILLQRGQVAGEGPVSALTAQYLTRMEPAVEERPPANQQIVKIKSVQFFDESGRAGLQFRTGYPLRARIDYEASAEVGPAVFRLHFVGLDERLHCEFVSGMNAAAQVVPAGLGAIEFLCEEIGLQPGIYHLDAKVERPDGSELAVQRRCALIHMGEGKQVHGTFYAPHTWRPVSELTPPSTQEASQHLSGII